MTPHLTCIRAILVSNLGRGTEYPGWGFRGFLSASKNMQGLNFEVAHDFFFRILSNSLIIDRRAIRGYIVQDSDSVIK
jgi:hypothetical protein